MEQQCAGALSCAGSPSALWSTNSTERDIHSRYSSNKYFEVFIQLETLSSFTLSFVIIYFRISFHLFSVYLYFITILSIMNSYDLFVFKLGTLKTTELILKYFFIVDFNTCETVGKNLLKILIQYQNAINIQVQIIV